MDVHSTVFKLVASSGTDTRFGDPYLLAEAARLTGRPPPEVWEALWALTADGLIYLDASGHSKDNWHWRISSIGAKTVSGGPWEPRDPEGYLARLHRRIPDLDPVAVRYIEEALRSFNARCYLASSVMLGVASEQVFIQLAQSVADALGSSAENLRKALDNPNTSSTSGSSRCAAG